MLIELSYLYENDITFTDSYSILMKKRQRYIEDPNPQIKIQIFDPGEESLKLS